MIRAMVVAIDRLVIHLIYLVYAVKGLVMAPATIERCTEVGTQSR